MGYGERRTTRIKPTSTALIKIMKQIRRNFCLLIVPHEAYFNIEEIRFHTRSAEKNNILTIYTFITFCYHQEGTR